MHLFKDQKHFPEGVVLKKRDTRSSGEQGNTLRNSKEQAQSVEFVVFYTQITASGKKKGFSPAMVGGSFFFCSAKRIGRFTFR